MNSIKVYGRIRPSARNGSDSPLVPTDKFVNIHQGQSKKSFELHRIFTAAATQSEIFETVSKKIVEDSAEGFNGTIFAYGQTGSGKTHTMLGPSDEDSWSDPDRKGLIPRTIEYLFDLLEEKSRQCQKFTYVVQTEFVELYNEEIFDLLNSKAKVQLRDCGNVIQLLGARSETVDSSLGLMQVVRRGWKSRSTGATEMNDESSRSHALLIIKIETTELTGGLKKKRFSTLNLVDLAGSERQAHTKASGERLKEATNINQSLTVLGRCIRVLAQTSTTKPHVPFRDSHLTHILKNSLGGNAKTAVIVSMHPDPEFLPESLSTLVFAQSCTLIKNVVRRNEEMTGDQENSYRNAIQQLREELDAARAAAREDFAKELESSKEANRQLSEENSILRAENSDLRCKYDMALLKYKFGVPKEDAITEFKTFISKSSIDSCSIGEFQAKYLTLKLECEAHEKTARMYLDELNDLRSRYQETLNESIHMGTPGKPRRSSSRPKRRETQYKHSPSRLAELAEDPDSVALQEAQLDVARLESEVQSWKQKCETITETEYEKARAQSEKITVLQKEVQIFSTKYEAIESERDELIGKVERSGKQLDQLLSTIGENAKIIEDLKSNHKKTEEDLQNQLNQLELLLSESQRSSTDAHQTIEDLKQKLDIKSVLVASHEKDILKKSEVIAGLERQLDENVARLSDYDLLKRRYDELIGDKEHWEKRIDDAKKAMSKQFEEHQVDLKNLNTKKDKDIEFLKKSLESTEKMNKQYEKTIKIIKTEEQKKFDEKVADIEKVFKDMQIAAVKRKEDELKRESLNMLESSKFSSENRIRELEEQVQTLHQQHTEDSELLKGQVGSKHNKISYIEKMRQRIVDLEQTISRARTENARLSAQIRDSDKPVLRSRNRNQ